jgi:hypothetical protein
MNDKGAGNWPPIPAEVADLLEPELPGLTRDILAAIAAEVPEYARPLEGAFGVGIRAGVSEALGQFVALIRDPALSREPGREVYVALGRGEHRQGRSLDSLLAAYRVGARVAWERLSHAGAEAGLEPTVLYGLAASIFAYIDELSAESVEGYAMEQSAREGAREQLRGRLLASLTGPWPPEPAQLEALAEEAGWRLPVTLAAMACAPEAVARIARRLPPETLAGTISGAGALLISDPAAPGSAARIEAALAGQPAVIGPAVALAAARDSWEEASAVWAAHAAGGLAAGEGSPIPSAECLVDLVLWEGSARLRRVVDQRLEPLADETPASRDRLLETLAAFLRHQGRIAPVAEELHVHPQTVRYRVTRLRELLAEQLADPDARFELEVALRATSSE